MTMTGENVDGVEDGHPLNGNWCCYLDDIDHMDENDHSG